MRLVGEKFHHGAALTGFFDKLLPNQPEHRRLYAGADHDIDLDESVRRSIGPEPFAVVYPPDFPAESMSSHPATLRLIQILLKSFGARHVLEIGGFVGRSALWIAEAGCTVMTIERGLEFAALAMHNVGKNDRLHRIRVVQGDAMMISLDAGSFDAVFIDGDKEHYLEYFLMAERIVKPRGMVIVDDCFFHGDALNEEPTTAKGRGVKRFMDHMAGLDGWVKLALPLGNGLFVAMRIA